MNLIDPTPDDRTGPGPLASADPFAAGDEVLDRVKSVARQITERVRKLTEDTELDHQALADDSTATQPPLP